MSNVIDAEGKGDYIKCIYTKTFPATLPDMFPGIWRALPMTIKDVARHCGVSVSTVSRVLNDRPDVSESVRERVLKAVRKLNYVPNGSARDLVAPVADTVGILFRGDSSPFYADIIRAMESIFSAGGYTTVIDSVRHGGDELWDGARLVRSKRLKGLVFLGGRFDYSPADIEKLDVPFVCCTYTNIFGALPMDSYSSVTIDDIKTGYDAAMSLIERGHKRIAVVLCNADDRSIGELRYMGYRKALEEKGIDFDSGLLLEAGEYSMAAVRETVEKAVDSGLDFSAVFAISDTFAIAVMRALSNKGLHVPGDCSVLGVDGIEMASYTVPSLCTFAQPTERLGEESARELIRMMEHGDGGRHIVLEANFTEGGSIARK